MKTTGSLSVNQIYQRTNPGVVDIKVTTSSGSAPTDNFGNPGSGGNGQSQQSQAEGSGFVIDGDGHIATNQHVVDGASSITVTFANGHKASAKVVGTDSSTDVAVIKVDAPKSELHPLTFADSKRSRSAPASWPSAARSASRAPSRPASSARSTARSRPRTTSRSRARSRPTPRSTTATRAARCSTRTATLSGSTPRSRATRAATTASASRSRRPPSSASPQQLISSGKVAHAYLGVQLGDGSGGATVGQVASGAPAADAGVRNGDVVTAIDGKAITSADALVNAVDAHKPGDTVTLKVKRGGSTNDVKVKLGTRPN